MGKMTPLNVPPTQHDNPALDLVRETNSKLHEIAALIDDLFYQNKSFRPQAVDDKPRTITAAHAELKRRKDRRTIFQKYDIFGDPGWEILLELYISDARGEKLSISAIGLDSGIAPSTSLRWVKYFEEIGFISRHGDTCDRRRHWLTLKSDAKEMLDAHFSH